MRSLSNRHLFTSESVTEGHPDKMADQISDTVLDAILTHDPDARVACETSITTGLVLVMGEISTECYVDIPRLVRRKILDIGYTRAKMGFDGETCAVLTAIDEQSPDIAAGVNISTADDPNLGAGDQGMMFGFACRETRALMPLPITLAHQLARRLAEVRHARIIPYIWPDGKTQVTVIYEGLRPVAVDTIVVSTQHQPAVELPQIRADIIEHVIRPVIPAALLSGSGRLYVNPTGRFVTGGPQADSGLTGRKIIVDTYGGYARHGGGAFSGKDATKVDRSAAYAARYVAKNIVAAGLAERCELQLAYAIGVASPLSIRIDTFGTGVVGDDQIIRLINENFDLRPTAIIQDLDLRRPIFSQIASYGHFGRDDLDLPWERIDRAAALRSGAGLGQLPSDPLADVIVTE
ncbi:MAG: methionine adenosyltransferase [Thermaerobacterales bacterium]